MLGLDLAGTGLALIFEGMLLNEMFVTEQNGIWYFYYIFY